MSDKAYKRLASSWWNGKDFLNQSTSVDGNLSFFIQLPVDEASIKYLRVGQVVLTTLRFLDIDEESTLRTRILRIDREPRSGVQVLCLAEEKQQQHDLIWTAAGTAAHYKKRRSERVPCFFPVKVATSEKGPAVSVWVLNISQHGAYITYQQQVRFEQTLYLEIAFPESDKPFRIPGWVKSIVNEAVQPGLGISFLFSSREQNQQLCKHVSRVKELYSGMAELDLLDESIELNLPADLFK